MRFKLPLFFIVLAALLVAARLCHLGILWAEEGLPLAAAQQMIGGKVLYRDIWFDKPPLLASIYLLWGAHAGWPLRLAGALYTLLACWIAYRFARDVWSEAEGLWAAALLGFFLIFNLPSAVIPLASDLLLVAPHLAAVWLAWKRKPFLSGVLAGIAFLVNPKGVLIGAACVLLDPAGILWIASGFAAVNGMAALWLWSAGALPAFWEQVFRWGRLYASAPLTESPLRNGLERTLNWVGFHLALVISAIWFLVRAKSFRWIGWCLLCFAGVAAGWRFFPRYYFLLLVPITMAAARGFMLLGRKRDFVALLLLIPATRFGPRYLWLATGRTEWADTAMDRDSRQAAALTHRLAGPGDTLFVWGFRPELYVYTGLPAATRFLDSQPLTGVPADRHLTQSEPLEKEAARARREELARSSPTFVIDGLGLFNPRLAMPRYPELRDWFAQYQEVGRSGESIIYRLRSRGSATAGLGYNAGSGTRVALRSRSAITCGPFGSRGSPL